MTETAVTNLAEERLNIVTLRYSAVCGHYTAAAVVDANAARGRYRSEAMSVPVLGGLSCRFVVDGVIYRSSR